MKKEPLPRLLPCYIDSLFHIVNQTIAAFVSLIDNSKGTAVIFITEGEEVMSQQVHLHDSFFSGHRLKVELLGFDDAQIVFCRFRYERGLFLYTANEGILLQSPGQSGLVLPDLPLL